MMANCNQRGVYTKIKRVFKTTASVFVIIMMMFIVTDGLTVEKAYGTTRAGQSAWAIVVGDETKAYVESELKGEQVIEGLEEYYRTKNSTVLEVSITPQVSVKYVEHVPEGTEVKRVKQIVDYLRPFVDVKTIEKIKTYEKIDYRIVYRRTQNMKLGTSRVKTRGTPGEKVVVRKILKVNGQQQSSKLISSKRLKKATTKVVLRGAANVTARKGKTFSFRTGADVVKYAKKFVGNPYEYGGTSLTKGADCSGFVYRVYKNMGVDLPRVDQDTVGKKVSYKNVKKGDILFYSDHVAIYAGNGKAIHAVNERLGIKVTDVNYTGKVLKVRRIFK